MKTAALVLLAAASVATAFRLPGSLPATPVSPRLAPVLKASSLLEQQRQQLVARPAGLAWGVRGGALKAAGAASDENSLKNWDPQQWIAPAFHNRGSVRLLAVLAGIGAVIHKTGTPVPRKMAAFVHLLSFGANLGAQLYTTFVLGIGAWGEGLVVVAICDLSLISSQHFPQPVMIKMLPRQWFGKLQVRVTWFDCSASHIPRGA